MRDLQLHIRGMLGRHEICQVGAGFSARIASKNKTLELALSIKLIPIKVPIISGESGGQ